MSQRILPSTGQASFEGRALRPALALRDLTVTRDCGVNAVQRVEQAIELWTDTAREFGAPVPEPGLSAWCWPRGQ